MRASVWSAVAAIALVSGCAAVNPLPQCDLYRYGRERQSLLEKSLVRLLPPAPGVITEMPLDYANVVDPSIVNKVLVQTTSAIRNPDGSMAVQARVLNCTDHVLQIEGRTSFFDDALRSSEPPTAWSRMILQGRTYETYSTRSAGSAASAYLIELREGS